MMTCPYCGANSFPTDEAHHPSCRMSKRKEDMCKPYQSYQSYHSYRYGPGKPTQLEPPKQKYDKRAEVFEFKGKNVRVGSKEFAIEGQRILIRGVGMKYWRTNGNPDTEYISFRFIHETSGDYLGPAWAITRKAFEQSAELYAPKVEPKFVTIGQLMTIDGKAPCEAGCRAILAYIRKTYSLSHSVDASRDAMIVGITKHCMLHKSWDVPISTQDLYDWYTKEYGVPMPYDYLVWMAAATGVVSYGNGGESPKNREMMYRALGIKR